MVPKKYFSVFQSILKDTINTLILICYEYNSANEFYNGIKKEIVRPVKHADNNGREPMYLTKTLAVIDELTYNKSRHRSRIKFLRLCFHTVRKPKTTTRWG